VMLALRLPFCVRGSPGEARSVVYFGPRVSVQISLRSSGRVTILDVADRLTVETTDTRRLTGEVRRLLQEGHRQFLVNLEAVHQIDSSGLAELVEAFTTTA